MWSFTDRGSESIRNLELYIGRDQPMIMGTKVGKKHVQELIEAFRTFNHHPDGMEIDTESRIYYKQSGFKYHIKGRRDNVKKLTV